MILKIIRYLIAFLVIIFFGFIGITFFFADYGPGESEFSRMGLSFVFNFIVGFFLGILVYPYWRLSAFLAWGVVLFGLIGLTRTLMGNRDDSVEVILVVIAPIAGSLIGGFTGTKTLGKLIKRLK
jgi:hypothetical protein